MEGPQAPPNLPADTASFLLPVSNPINILVGGAFGVGLVQFLAHLLVGRGPRMGPDRRRQLDQAEARGGEAVLAEEQALASRAEGAAVTTRIERGNPERVIVALAAELASDLIVVGAREGMGELPPGPESVGRVARYVLDHAPCDVLLVRR